MNSIYDLELLAKHLTRHYGEENAKRLMIKYKHNLWGRNGLAYALGKRDLEFFNLYFLKDVYIGDGLAELAPIHYEMWGIMNDMYTKNTHNQHAFILPRGTGKSLTGSLPVAVWANLYGFSPYTVIASAVDDTAKTFIKNIRNAIIDNEKIRMAFGEVYNPRLNNTSDRIELANKTMIQSLSSRSSFRGKSYLGNRITLLILDDFQSEENVSNKKQMEKHWKRFSDDSRNAIQKDNYKMIAMGTIIEKGDFYDKLTNLPTWKHTMEKAVLVDDVDRHFNEGKWGEFKRILFNGKGDGLEKAKEYYRENEEEMQYPLLWQDYWNCLDFALQYYENPVSFKQEMQLESGSGEDKLFTNIVYYNDYVEPTTLVIDPATSEKADSDYTAFALGNVSDDIIYVPFAYMERLEFEDYIRKTIELLKEFEGIDTVVVEKQTYSGADVLAMKNVIERDEELKYRGIIFENPHQSKNKQGKIESIVGDVNLGRVQFNNILRGSNTIEQLEEFTSVDNVKHDDFVDALAELILYLKEDNLESEVQLFDKSLLF